MSSFFSHYYDSQFEERIICFFLAFLARELIGDEYVKKIPSSIRKRNQRTSPPNILSAGNGVIPEPSVIPLKAGDRPVVYLSTPNRLIINEDR